MLLIQVAYSVAEEKAYEREFGAFAKLDLLSVKPSTGFR